MTREEAIDILVNATYSEEWQGNEKLTTAHLMAIEALEGVCFDEWCTDCKEYDTEKKCCPRFNRVIRGAMKREPCEDLISREEAIEAITETLDAIDHVPKWVFDKLTSAIEILPPADRSTDGDLISRAEAIRAITEYNEMPTENCYHEYNHGYKNGMNMAVHFLENIPSADRPRGEWVEQEDDYHHYWECSECGMGVGLDDIRNFCPNCGSDNRERREE